MRFFLVKFVSSVVLLAIMPVVTSAARAADLCRDIRLQCNGFEPNWQFTLALDGEGDQVVSFTDPENPDWQTAPLVVEACALQDSPTLILIVTPAPLELDARVRTETCVEPNDEVRPYSVDVRFNQGAQTSTPNRISGTGCCQLVP